MCEIVHLLIHICHDPIDWLTFASKDKCLADIFQEDIALRNEDICLEDICLEDVCLEDAYQEDICLKDICLEDGCLEDCCLEDICLRTLAWRTFTWTPSWCGHLPGPHLGADIYLDPILVRTFV